MGDPSGRNSLIPALWVVFKSEPCLVNPSVLSIKIPHGGVSVPIVFDFAKCMPTTDVEIIINYSSLETLETSFAKDDLSVTRTSEKLVFTSFNDTKVKFQIFSNNVTT